MNIKLSNGLKIKLNYSGQGSGANFDYDFQIIVIDKTKKPYKKKLLSRQDMMRINAPLGGRYAIQTIDDWWDRTDIFITDNKLILNRKPEGKLSIKINKLYNTDNESDITLDSFKDILKLEDDRFKRV